MEPSPITPPGERFAYPPGDIHDVPTFHASPPPRRNAPAATPRPGLRRPALPRGMQLHERHTGGNARNRGPGPIWHPHHRMRSARRQPPPRVEHTAHGPVRMVHGGRGRRSGRPGGTGADRRRLPPGRDRKMDGRRPAMPFRPACGNVMGRPAQHPQPGMELPLPAGGRMEFADALLPGGRRPGDADACRARPHVRPGGMAILAMKLAVAAVRPGAAA